MPRKKTGRSVAKGHRRSVKPARGGRRTISSQKRRVTGRKRVKQIA